MTTEPKARNNRRVPAIILGSLLVVMLISTLLFRAAVKGDIDLPALLGTKNNGVLIQPPQPIAGLPLLDANGGSFEFSKQPKQWTLLIPVAAHCEKQCEDTLYLTRQIHIALGKHSSRVRRYLLATEWPLDAGFERLLEQHPKLTIVRTGRGEFDRFFAKANLQPLRDQHYLLVDPDGWVMMHYRPNQDGKEVIQDLKFLLTNSREQED